MSEQATETLELDMRFRLSDYLALQLFIMWHYSLKRAPIFFVFAFAAIFLVAMLGGMSPSKIWLAMMRQWAFYFGLIVGTFVAVRLSHFILVLWNWQRRALAREMHLTAATAGITYSSGHVNVLVEWQAIGRIIRTKSAYFLLFKNVVLRLPYHAFTSGERRRFDEFAERGGTGAHARS